VFVQSRKFGIEGLIRTGDLGDDVWRYDAKSQCIVGQRSGTSIHLGQAMKVRIVSVNVPARQLNVLPSEPLVKEHRRGKKSKSAKKYRNNHTQRRLKRRK